MLKYIFLKLSYLSYTVVHEKIVTRSQNLIFVVLSLFILNLNKEIIG